MHKLIHIKRQILIKVAPKICYGATFKRIMKSHVTKTIQQTLPIIMANQDELSDEEIRFELLDEATKDELMANRKAKNTNRVTKQWFSCLKAFLKERKLPDLESIPDTDLPQILGEFYYSARKQKITDTEKFNEAQNDPKKKSALKHYKNSSLKSGRAALNRYFKGERGLDIISNELFIKANENFQSVTKKGKEDGRGEISSKIPISDEDMEKLSLYFQEKMMGKANGKFLQQLVVFNIIYQGGRRGHEYLRNMKKDTFEIKTDHDGRKYTVQVVKELTKNHQADDTSETYYNYITIYCKISFKIYENKKKTSVLSCYQLLHYDKTHGNRFIAFSLSASVLLSE